MTGVHKHSSADLTNAHWVKASASETAQGCVEVAFLSSGQVGLRDSKNPSGPKLIFTEHEWACFLDGVARGEFHQK